MTDHLPVAHQTSLPRAVLALAAGALTAGVMTSTFHHAVVVLDWGGWKGSGSIRLFVAEWILFSAAFGAGMLAASPFWLVLHLMGVRGGGAAATLGGCLSFAAAIVVAGPALIVQPVDPRMLPLFALPLTVIGAIAGAVVWRVAYRRVPHGFSP